MLLLFFCFSSSCHSIHTMEHEFYECPEYLSNTPAEVERTEEYEYEVQFCIGLTFWFIPMLYSTWDSTAQFVHHFGSEQVSLIRQDWNKILSAYSSLPG